MLFALPEPSRVADAAVGGLFWFAYSVASQFVERFVVTNFDSSIHPFHASPLVGVVRFAPIAIVALPMVGLEAADDPTSAPLTYKLAVAPSYPPATWVPVATLKVPAARKVPLTTNSHLAFELAPSVPR